MSPSLHSSLRPFFTPDGVAVIGASATPGKLGYGVIANLIKSGYRGPIYPVNPRADEILGLPAYADITSVPDPVELAVIIIPAPAIPDALRACGQRGIRAAAILSGGFAEAGSEGEARQQEMLDIAHTYGMRLVGPNGVGVLNPHSGLNTTFIEQIPKPGDIAFLSQSGALGGALIDWAKGEHIGLSYFASLGNAADVTETDFISALADDPHTRVITLYIEGIQDGVRFMEVARSTTPHTPIVALKVGVTDEGARAVASHTASIGGSDEAYSAAFKQTGVIRVRSVEELFDTAVALSYQQPPAGKRVAILTNAGGPAAVAADAVARNGLQAPAPDDDTQAELRAALGPAAQLFNPIDMLGAASASEYAAAAHLLLQSETYDALLVILVPNTANDPVAVADAIAQVAGNSTKPIYACFMGDVSIRQGRQRLHQHRIPVYDFPEHGAQAIASALAWKQVKASPPTLAKAVNLDFYRDFALEMQQKADRGQNYVGEIELYPWLATLGLPIPAWRAAYTRSEAEAFAQEHVGPFALKVISPDILHKSDVRGVELNVSAAQVGKMYWEVQARVRRRARKAGLQGVLIQQMARPGTEVIIGMRRDPTFGPMLMFGGGGVYVEALRDISFRIAPLGEREARAMIAETVVGRLLLRGARGQKPGDAEALIDLIVRVSQLVMATPAFSEFELNPVIVHPAGQGVSVVDARAILLIAGNY